MQQNSAAERANAAAAAAERGIFSHERGPPTNAAAERNVHGAQDLLHLKYGEEGQFRSQDHIKREELGVTNHIRIPFENALMRHEQVG